MQNILESMSRAELIEKIISTNNMAGEATDAMRSQGKEVMVAIGDRNPMAMAPLKRMDEMYKELLEVHKESAIKILTESALSTDELRELSKLQDTPLMQKYRAARSQIVQEFDTRHQEFLDGLGDAAYQIRYAHLFMAVLNALKFLNPGITMQEATVLATSCLKATAPEAVPRKLPEITLVPAEMTEHFKKMGNGQQLAGGFVMPMPTKEKKEIQ